MSRAQIPLFLVAHSVGCDNILCEDRRRGDRTHTHVHVHIEGNCRDEPIDGERRIGTIAEVTCIFCRLRQRQRWGETIVPSHEAERRALARRRQS